jgi:hypothetical protein
MIRLKQVRQHLGKTWLTVQYDVPARPGVVCAADLDFLTLRRALLEKQAETGERPTLDDVRAMLIAWVNELRADYEAIERDYDFTKFIGVDLEAEK